MKTVQIENGKLPSFAIEVGESVVWENNDIVAYQLNAGEGSAFKFDIGIIFPGECSSPVWFSVKSPAEGFEYGNGLAPGVSAKVFVGVPVADTGHENGGHNHGGHDHSAGHDQLKHFHGFVTNGQSGDKIYMTHTPIFLDERHHFQIILQASFVEQAHLDRYNALRNSEYGSGKVQLFFDHMALIDIQSGAIKELVADHLRWYPDVPTVRPGLVMPAVSTKVLEFKDARIKIDKVLHFRQFTPDEPYPEHMTYLMYGNEKQVFFDHYISRAPCFHSVGKLAQVPDFWNAKYFDGTLKFGIPSRRIVDASPKNIKRVAFLDNNTHLLWGSPSGSIAPVDPLEREPVDANKNRTFDVIVNGAASKIIVSNLLHFDATRLLNEGLGF